MKRRSSYILGGATLACALGIGYIMEYGVPGQTAAFDGPVEVTDITTVSSAVPTPRLPREIMLDDEIDLTEVAIDLEGGPMASPAPDAATAVPRDTPNAETVQAPACDITMDASTLAGAMVKLWIDAPCNGSERLTLHHNGLMFTEVLDDSGQIEIKVPALAENAMFIASFASGDSATTTIEVPSMPFYDRVAVQWRGETGLQLHAREFEAAYFSDGHIWSDSAGDLARTAAGESGFLTRIGNASAPEALMAEVYSFPAGTAQRSGTVALSVEAEITNLNCNSTIEAQTLELRGEGAMRVRDLSVDIPACDATGDFLVLKNIVDDLKIASR